MTIRAVFLDAGETMIHPHPSFPELFSEVLRQAGHETSLERIAETVSVYSKRWSEEARSANRRLWSVSRDASRAFWLEVYRGFLADVGVDGDRDGLAERLYATFSDPAHYRAYPDVLPALEGLRRAGYALGVISNFEDWLELVFEAVRLTPYFPVRVISGVEGVEKPDPRIFELALERARVAAQESLYVGDHPFFDVEAAESAGMRAVLVDRRDRFPAFEGLRVASLVELPELVASL